MYNDEGNFDNTTPVEDTAVDNNVVPIQTEQPIENTTPVTDYQYDAQQSYNYPAYGSNSSDDEEEDNSGSKRKLFTIGIIIFILLLLFGFGYFIYNNILNKSKDTTAKLDNITIENGTLNPTFSPNNTTYNVETSSKNIKFICTYNKKEVDIKGCNETITIDENVINEYKIKNDNKEYVFKIVKLSEDAPIINAVKGNSNSWVKAITLKVDASFKTDAHETAYSFDGGKTWQKGSSKKFTKNEVVSIIIRDINENISTIYTEEIKNIDNKGPVVTVTKTTGRVVALTLKDSASGIVGWTVTKSTAVPTSWTKVNVTKDTVIKYNTTSNGTYYAWAKDNVGNTSYKKFSIGETPVQPDTPDDPVEPEKPTNPNPTKESIIISGVSGNSDKWTTSVGLTVTAKSNSKDAVLSYSFDGGKTWQNSNSKKILSNGTYSIVVKNKNTNVTSSATTQVVSSIDSVAPTCSKITGQGTTWTNNARTITVICSDTGGSGCTAATTLKTYTTTTKTHNIVITDKAGNSTLCPVNVYVDRSGPKLTAKSFTNEKGKIYKFQIFVEDNESGINLKTVKYKEKILKNGIDNIWHSHWDNEKEIASATGINYNYRFTKEIGLYNYFTIKAEDNLGNITEINLSYDE